VTVKKRDSRPRSERDDTDASLRDERFKSDREVDRRRQSVEGVAKAVVSRARDDADELLRSSREVDDPNPDARESRARKTEDATIRRTRKAADVKLEDESGERTRALAALFLLERNLTDQNLLAERNRADLVVNRRDDFLGMVAHDLRGFMGEIALRATSLGRFSGDDENGRKVRQIGERIQRSTASMNRLVGDLLDIAAIEAGKLTVQISRGDLSSMLRDAAEGLRSAVEAKNIVFAVDARPDPVMASFDLDRVVQVLGNVVSNAVKFTPPGGRISLRLEARDRVAKLTVSDSGEGIPPDKLEAIFDRFAQVRPDRRGLGLGLYISKCLMKAQGGEIWATSASGGGSQFHLTLPLS
jgi:signal transduction histidine kinase